MQTQPFGDYHYVQGVCFLLTLLTRLRTLTVGYSHISKQHFRTHSVLLTHNTIEGNMNVWVTRACWRL